MPRIPVRWVAALVLAASPVIAAAADFPNIADERLPLRGAQASRPSDAVRRAKYQVGATPADALSPGRDGAASPNEVPTPETSDLIGPDYGPGGPFEDYGGPGYDCDSDSCCSAAFWVRAEYLYWWMQGMDVPPLVTTGPSVNQPGFIDSPGTTILFGGRGLNDFGRSGGRVTAGWWLDDCQLFGLEGDYFGLARATSTFSATSGGDPILSRPFFDVRPSLTGQNVEQVASPGTIAGTVGVNVPTTFQSAGLRMLFNLCCGEHCYNDYTFDWFNGHGGYRIDFLLGYRFARLTDSVSVQENLTSLSTALPAGTFVVNDSFRTANTFNGIELGTQMVGFRGRVSIEFLSKLALGGVDQIVNINGSTLTNQGGTTTLSPGGLLALPSNIGQFQRGHFAIMPQLGLNAGFQITPRMRALLGYTFVYLSQVARAGEQIDFEVNSSQLPNNPSPPSGDLRHPQFVFHETDFWAQGINLGLDYCW
jgi:hypothetical protein